ncbi:ABC transporter [Aeromicrobium sp. Root495]|uniref:ABC-F family ATP-binding cassette domain-containing protein n=1 Tax=Aeromicrobium sp. Root495 TaxID=1736550 RepID=UPI0006FBA6C8|nr:ATP-binding cassette domain-containing protein [Aeromicrobium sp. Root495]KQY58588.1 ABC transporter [Aeromicrobium sp. Root495]
MSVHLQHLHFSWPDGSDVLDDVSLDLGPGVHGLVGANGSGKSTLLRLLIGELQATGGSVDVVGVLAHLPQDPLLGSERTVADALGISTVRSALRAVEQGSTEPSDYDTVGDDWAVEDRAAVQLAGLGLGHLGLDRPLDAVSGGELVLLALAGRLLRRPDVLLLDEPTNNLDGPARERVLTALRSFGGTAVVASHDRVLLERVDDVLEVRDRKVRRFAGPYSAYEATVGLEQEAAERVVRDAQADVRKQKRELADTQVKLARRARTGARAEREKRVPKIIAHGRRMQAEVSAGRLRNEHEDKAREAQGRLDDAESAVRDDREIRLELPRTRVPAGRDVLVTHGLVLDRTGRRVDLHVRGPERIGVVGRNGSGKTTLLETLVGRLAPASGSAGLSVPCGYLPQRADLLDPTLDVVENVRRHAPETSVHEVRAQLARLLFRGDAPLRPAGTLSGGERLRANLACLLLGDVQLLVLDEPTNNLDLVSVGHLAQALQSFEGALLVVSHDEHFLDDLRLDRRLAVD